jgi:hypothetical protein
MQSLTAGAEASRDWLLARGLTDVPLRWYVELTLEAKASDTQFELNIYPEEWGFVFRRAARVSSIRVTDIPFVHGRDDYELIRRPTTLEAIHGLLRELEQRYAIELAYARAVVRTNIPRGSNIVRAWIAGPS